MKYLKLVVNNEKKRREIFFNKSELKLILNLYAQMVSGGEWKDYGLSISKKEVSFNVYHRTSGSINRLLIHVFSICSSYQYCGHKRCLY